MRGIDGSPSLLRQVMRSQLYKMLIRKVTPLVTCKMAD